MATFSDDFNRADGAIGSNYQTLTGDLAVVSGNQLRGSGGGLGVAVIPTAAAFTASSNAHQLTVSYVRRDTDTPGELLLAICGDGTWVNEWHGPGYAVQSLFEYVTLLRDNVTVVGLTPIPGYPGNTTNVTLRLSHDGAGEVTVDANWGSGWVNAITYNDPTPLNRTRIVFGWSAIPGPFSYADNVVAADLGPSGVSGTIAVTQAAQTMSAAGYPTTTGTAALTQATQTMSAAGGQTHTGTAPIVQAAQTMAATGAQTHTGTIAATQADQTMTAAGNVGAPVTGTAALTQADQTMTAAGTAPSVGTAAATQADQTMTAAGSQTHTGTSAWTQDAQTMAGNGTIGSAVGGTMAVTQADNVMTAAGTTIVTATGALVQAGQTMTASGTVTPAAVNKLRLGTVTVANLKMGATQATRAYQGTTLVWED